MNFDTTLFIVRQFVPDIKVKFKKNSVLMKLISYILFFNKNFMTRFITTIGKTVYFPTEKSVIIKPIGSSFTLLHELVHILDYKKYGLLFSLSYLLPQILAIFTLLFFISKWFLLFGLFILPIPAYFRMRWEMRAYNITLYCMYLLSKKEKINMEQQKQFVVDQFITSNYYFMFPFRGYIESKLNKAIELMKKDELLYTDKTMNAVKNIVKDCLNR